MEQEDLLYMYKESWDAFLEAYKEKLDQNTQLITLAGEYADALEGEGYEKEAQKIREKLGKILET